MWFLDHAFNWEGMKLVFLLWNIPFPFPYVSYALGITNVWVRDYIIGTLGVGISTFNYVLIGTQITSLTDEDEGPHHDKGKNMFFIVLGVEILCMIVFTYFIVWAAR